MVPYILPCIAHFEEFEEKDPEKSAGALHVGAKEGAQFRKDLASPLRELSLASKGLYGARRFRVAVPNASLKSGYSSRDTLNPKA